MRTAPVRTLLRAALVAVLLVPAALAQHKDERIGFSILTPKDWSAIPQKADERWLIADYQSQKSFFWTEKGGWTVEHKPDMLAIAFVSEQVKEQAKVSKKKDKQGNDVILIELDSPYKDYKDYMKRRYSGGGWYIDKEDTTKVGGVDVTTYEIRVDKLSSDGPKRIVTWIYHIPDVDVAVQFECLQDAWPKLKSEVTKCLKSFKRIERSGEALVRQVSTGHRLTLFEADELTPEERKNWRLSAEQEVHERARKELTPGWTVKKLGRFLVLFDCDEKYARKVAEQAEAVWDWLDETFPEVGPKEYVRVPVIRICKNEEELRQFQRTGDWSWDDLEIVTCQDYGGTTSWQLGRVNSRILQLWFNDKDRELGFALPAWFGGGLNDLVEQARVDKGRLEFVRDVSNRDEVRELIRTGKAMHARELMQITKSELWGDGGQSYFAVRYQSQALVSFLLDGSASKNPRTKTVLQDYLAGLKRVQAEIAAENKSKQDAGTKKPETEEEEEAAFRAQRQGYKDSEKRVLDEAFRSAFGGWSDKDWERFDEVYFQSVG